VYDLKRSCKDTRLMSDFNAGLAFSEQFLSKRRFFFTRLFTRLDALYVRVHGERSLSNQMVKVCNRTVGLTEFFSNKRNES
jgi:hypothetical protein